MTERPPLYPEPPEAAHGRALRVLDEIDERNERIYALADALAGALPEARGAAHALLGLLHDLAADTASLGMLRNELEDMRPPAADAEAAAHVV